MGHFNKNAVWHDKIYQLERTDPVVGGEGGISNQAPKELADRTEWLKQQIELQQCDSIADLRNIEPTENTQTIFIKGYYTGTTVGGGYFIADFTDNSTADNDGTVIVTAGGKRWKRIYTEITPFDFGAIGDMAFDNAEVFARLEATFKNTPINLMGKMFKVSRDFTGNQYFNGSLKTDVVGAYSKQHLHSGGGLYVKHIGNSGHLFDLKPVLNDGLTFYLQGMYQDFKTGDIWTLQGDAGKDHENHKSSLIKYKINYGTELEPVFYSLPSQDIGHQCFGIQYDEFTRYFWTMAGSSKGTERAKYVVRFTVNETTRQIKDQRFFKIDDDLANGNANRCLTITPNGEFLIVTTGRNIVNAQGTTYLWGIKVFRIADIVASSDEHLPTPVFDFPFHRIKSYAVQSITSDGEYIYVQHGDWSMSRNAMQVYTLDGAHVLTDEQCFIGIDYAKDIQNKGGTAYYEPETVCIMQDGRDYMLTYGIVSGMAKDTNYKRFAIFGSMQKKPMMARSYGNMPAIIFASTHDIGFPKGQGISFVEVDNQGNVARKGNFSNGVFEILTEGKDAQVRVKSQLRSGIVQVSGSGNLGIFDSTNDRYLIYSGLDGIAKLGTSTPTNASGNEVASAGWVKGLIKSSQRTNGWVKLPDGLIFQWGRYSASNGSTFNYPIAFNEPPFIVQCTDRNNEGTQAHTITTRNETTTSFDIISGAIGAFTMWAVGK